MNINNTNDILVRGDIHALFQGQSIDDLMIDYMSENAIPGMTLAIVQAPYITRVIGCGFADIATKRLASMQTVFHIGEMTNGYTAVAIMQLKEAGKLHLNDCLVQFVQNIPKIWHAITIKDLLTHSSGIPDYTENTRFNHANDYHFNDIIALVQDEPLLFQSGTQMCKSLTNPYLLGMVIEAVSDMSYQDYVTEHQISRIGLKNTFFIANIQSIHNEVNNASSPFKHTQFLKDPTLMNPSEIATGYQQKQAALNPTPAISWTASFAASGMLASAQDISLWDIALAGDILVSNAEDRDFLYHAVLINDTLIPGNAGWTFPGHKGLMFLRGNLPGHSSILTRYTAPTELLCVTLLANKGDLPDLDILSRKIAAALEQNLCIPTCSPWSEIIQSPYSVKQTIERTAQLIQKNGGTVFAHINHSDEAQSVHQVLPETEVLIVGNPAKGTLLMQKNAAIALDLPFRIMATQDAQGQVWLSFTDPIKLAKEYHLDTEHFFELTQIASTIKHLCQKVVSTQSMV